MGDGLYNQFVIDEDIKGEYMSRRIQRSIAYLIRRFLENGANTSFVHNQEVRIPVELKKTKKEFKIKRFIQK